MSRSYCYADVAPYNMCELSWERLSGYLRAERYRPVKDIDTDVLEVSKEQFDAIPIMGFELGDQLVGFARWQGDHLSTIYISPEHRGRGLATYLINTMQFRSLHVRKDNIQAAVYYSRLDFRVVADLADSNRWQMYR